MYLELFVNVFWKVDVVYFDYFFVFFVGFFYCFGYDVGDFLWVWGIVDDEF